MKKAILYLHGKGGSAGEAEQYRKNCPGYEIVGVEYPSESPWAAEGPIRAAYNEARKGCGQITLLANSIGAYFGMHALQRCALEKALFISPVLDMERLICTMMGWAGVSEEQLRQQGEIPTAFGETLFWQYLCYVRSHPIIWRVPTEILYAGRDQLIDRPTVDGFVAGHPAHLTVMEEGEHWFHTEEQLAFLDGWMKRVL